MKANQTWVLIADGARASVLAYNDPDNRLELVKGGDLCHINKPTRELVSTKRGRVFNSADGSRSAMERPTDPHMLEKKRFAQRVADFLSNRSARYKRLIVVAAPKTLGDLRQSFPDSVKAKVSDEFDKDLTSVPLNDVQGHLKHMMCY